MTSPFDYKGQPSQNGLELQKNRNRAYRASVHVPPGTSLLDSNQIRTQKANEQFGKRQRFDFGQK